MSQFKNRQELLRAYADLLDRSEKAGIKPEWKWNNWTRTDLMSTSEHIESYELPVAIVEGRHVWIGDELWSTQHGKMVTVVDGIKGFILLEKDDYATSYSPNTFTWTQPATKKNTIKIYGWVNPNSGATYTSILDSGLEHCVRYPKLDDDIEVEG